jgi:hypothetical protein
MHTRFTEIRKSHKCPTHQQNITTPPSRLTLRPIATYTPPHSRRPSSSPAARLPKKSHLKAKKKPFRARFDHAHGAQRPLTRDVFTSGRKSGPRYGAQPLPLTRESLLPRLPTRIPSRSRPPPHRPDIPPANRRYAIIRQTRRHGERVARFPPRAGRFDG